MLTEAERRAVRLVESRFHVDHEQVEELVRAVLDRRAQGGAADLIVALEQQGMLTEAQLRELHAELGRTSLDLSVVPALARDGATVALASEPEWLGSYRVLRRLGEGGMGAVYLAFDKREQRQVAVKVLAPEYADVPALLDRFRREGQSGALLNHPHIVRAYEAGLDAVTGLHYLVMEYIDGPNVHALLERYHRFEVADAVRIVLDVAHGLAYAHAQAIIHRDIKPGNILLTASGQAKLSDLGLAKKVDEVSHLTSHRQGVGTPYYVPYEQALNAKRADARSDIYALGATLYHLLTGTVPFPGDSSIEVVQRKETGIYTPARVLNPEVPAELETILARMLARRPEDRYQSAADLGLALQQTGLAAPALSFLGPERKLEALDTHTDSDGQPTALDLQPEPAAVPPLWFLRYRDLDGTPRKCRLTVKEIGKRVRRGSLPVNAEAAASSAGAFAVITTIPALAAAILTHEPVTPLPPTGPVLRARWLIPAAIAAGLALLSAWLR